MNDVTADQIAAAFQRKLRGIWWPNIVVNHDSTLSETPETDSISESPEALARAFVAAVERDTAHFIVQGFEAVEILTRLSSSTFSGAGSTDSAGEIVGKLVL